MGRRGRNGRVAHVHRLADVRRVARRARDASADHRERGMERQPFTRARGERMSPSRTLVALVLVVSTAAVARVAGRPDAMPTVNLGALPYRLDTWVGHDEQPLDEETVRILA